jgi:hypothetical protein
MYYLSYGETPLVNCGSRSYFHHIAITCLLYSYYLLYSHTLYCFPLDMLIPFVSSKPMRLTTSSQVGNKVLGCVCAGSTLLLAKDKSTSIINGALVGVLLSQSASPSVVIVCSSPDRHTLVSYRGERLTAVLIIPSSRGFPTTWP